MSPIAAYQSIVQLAQPLLEFLVALIGSLGWNESRRYSLSVTGVGLETG